MTTDQTARAPQARSKHSGRNSFGSSSNMAAQIGAGLVAAFVGYAYTAIRPPAPRTCGSPSGPPVTSLRVKLDDGRHLAYKENGIPKEEAKHKIILCHGLNDSKEFSLALSQEFMKEFGIYILSFDRAGYGESDPNPSRSVKSEAFDIQELADKLKLGPKFYLIGNSIGACSVYGCLKYIPHRLSGAAMAVPFANYWWKCFPSKLSHEALGKLLVQDQWTCRVARYVPWLLNWWMTQRWFPSFSVMQGNLGAFSTSDIEIIKQWSEVEKENEEKARQQGDHECLYRDMIVGFGKWEFEPTDITNPFPNNEGSVHIWHGIEDKLIPCMLNRFLSQQLPWIKYHEVPDAGHLLIHNPTYCEVIFRTLLSS